MTRTAAGERYCSQHHRPRSQCRPVDRHVESLRASVELMAAVAARVEAVGLPSVNEGMEMALEAWVRAPLASVAKRALQDKRIKYLPPGLDDAEPAPAAPRTEREAAAREYEPREPAAPRCGQPTGSRGRPDDICGRLEGHAGRHKGQAAMRRRNERKAKERRGEPLEPPLGLIRPRCGASLGAQALGGPGSQCGRPQGHDGQHMSAASYAKKLDRERNRPPRDSGGNGAAPPSEPRTPVPVAPATAVFMEPGGKPVITAPVPDRKKGQR